MGRNKLTFECYNQNLLIKDCFMKKLLLLFFACIFLSAKPIVSVSIAPQAFFVQKIAKDTVDINIILAQNTDEHNFEFKPNIVKDLEKSDLYFTIGLEFENVFLDKFKNNFKNLSIINTQENIKLIPNEFMHEEDGHYEKHEHEEHEDHKHEKHEKHKHLGLDIHTWLDPVLVKTQAQNITKALSQKYPQNAEIYAANSELFLKELDALNTKIKEKFKDIKMKEFIVYHPSWGYFASRYGLEQIPVEIEGKEPKPKDLQNLIKLAKKHKIKIIFVQPGFSENAAKTLAKECGASIVSINHLALDWEKELLRTADVLRQSLQ